ncbi:MAG: hypothetical protein K0R59_4150, partial [Sphingobacterium sp.]|nr:hypothetical protein [Sphingobacterium sp.]
MSLRTLMQTNRIGLLKIFSFSLFKELNTIQILRLHYQSIYQALTKIRIFLFP